MKFLLTSGGVSNKSIENALVDMLGKPISESIAIFIPTAVYPLPGTAGIIWQQVCGLTGAPMCELGWKSIGLLELTALPSIKEESWLPTVQEADVILMEGGDCQYLTYWMRQSGFADLLSTLPLEKVYVGLSAGSMIMTSYGTTYGGHNLPPETDKSLSLFDFALLPHMDHEQFPDNSMANLEIEAASIPMPSYAIDDQSALKIVDGVVEVISEGNWKLFNS